MLVKKLHPSVQLCFYLRMISQAGTTPLLLLAWYDVVYLMIFYLIIKGNLSRIFLIQFHCTIKYQIILIGNYLSRSLLYHTKILSLYLNKCSEKNNNTILFQGHNINDCQTYYIVLSWACMAIYTIDSQTLYKYNFFKVSQISD